MAVYGGEQEDLIHEIKALEKERRIALSKVSFYQHQIFRVQFSKGVRNQVKELRSKISLWEQRAKASQRKIEVKKQELAYLRES